MNINSDPLQIEKARYVELVEVNMVKISEHFDIEIVDEAVESNKIQKKFVYPKVDESLVDFLHLYKSKESEVMLCPRYSAVFNKKLPRRWRMLDSINKKEIGRTKSLSFTLTKWECPRRGKKFPNHHRNGSNTYVSISNAPQWKWVRPT